MRLTLEVLNLATLSDDPSVYDRLTADTFTEALAPMVESGSLSVEEAGRSVLVLVRYAKHRASALRNRAQHPGRAEADDLVCEAIRRTLPAPLRW